MIMEKGFPGALFLFIFRFKLLVFSFVVSCNICCVYDVISCIYDHLQHNSTVPVCEDYLVDVWGEMVCIVEPVFRK